MSKLFAFLAFGFALTSAFETHLLVSQSNANKQQARQLMCFDAADNVVFDGSFHECRLVAIRELSDDR